MPEWGLPSGAGAVPLARQLALDSLPGLPRTVADSVALVVSELVTNGVRHGGTDLNLKVNRLADCVQVEVTDNGLGRPTPKSPQPNEPHGRGLQIVQALTRRWGVLPGPAGVGKTVWCQVGLTNRPAGVASHR